MAFDTDSLNNEKFELFLIENTISQQKAFVSANPQKKTLIEQLAIKYLQDLSHTSAKNDLMLKAWFLLPKSESKDVRLNDISVNTTLFSECLKSVVKNKEFWRIKQLKKCGFNLDVEIDGSTLLHKLCEYGDLEAVRKMLKFKSNIHVYNQEGLTPLHIALREGYIEIGRALIGAGADVMAKDSFQKTPIHYLCERGDVEMALKLFQKAIPTLSPLEAIEKAARDGLSDIAKRLIDDLENVNDVVGSHHESLNKGETLLHALTESFPANLEVLRYLKEKGADFEKLNENGNTPLQKALQSPFTEEKVIEFLMDSVVSPKEKVNLLTFAIQAESSPKFIEILVDKGADLHQKNSVGNYPVEVAILLDPPRLEILKVLIAKGLKMDEAVDSQGNTPLHIALLTGRPNQELIQFILDNGGDLNANNREGETCEWLIHISKLPINLTSQNPEGVMEFKLRKLLANNFSVDIFSSEKGNVFTLEGGRGVVGQEEVMVLLKELQAQSTEFLSLDEVCTEIEKGVKKAQGRSEKVVRQFAKGKTLMFSTGWRNHEIEVTFIDDYMLVTNRGEGRKKASIVAFKIDRDKPFPLEDIVKLQYRSRNLSFKEGTQYFYDDLPKTLGYDPKKQDLICQVMESKCRESSQKTGNCWWLSHKSAVLGIVTMQALLKEEARGYSSDHERKKAYEKIFDSTQVVYRYFSEYSDTQLFKKYLERPPDGAGRDHHLVKLVARKTRSRERRMKVKGFIQNSYALLGKLLGNKSSKKLPPLYTQKDVKEWLEEYRENYHLDRHFREAKK